MLCYSILCYIIIFSPSCACWGQGVGGHGGCRGGEPHASRRRRAAVAPQFSCRGQAASSRAVEIACSAHYEMRRPPLAQTPPHRYPALAQPAHETLDACCRTPSGPSRAELRLRPGGGLPRGEGSFLRNSFFVFSC